MGKIFEDFPSQYQRVLRNYLVQGGEDPLNNAYELGRAALAEDVGLLDLAYIHQGALMNILQEQPVSQERLVLRVKAAGRFLGEALSPFEVSRLSSKDANSALRKLYDVLEAEAKRIAHALHDESAQMLATVYLELADIARESPKRVAQRVNLVVRHLDEVREQLRQLSHELRPLILDQLGLMPALAFLSHGIKKRSGLEVEIIGETSGRLPQPVETVLYRTVQEALNNITRHAEANKAEVKVWVEDSSIFCVISDDGIGFELPQDGKGKFRGLGLVGIHERVGALNGNCEIVSSPAGGTKLKVTIPL